MDFIDIVLRLGCALVVGCALGLNRDLHGAVGFWSLAVFLILSVSGVYLAFPVTVQDSCSGLT